MTSSHLSFLARRAFFPAALAFAISASAPSATAQETLDAAAAREHLTQGYKLKQQGQLKDALPHLVESLRLDPKLKTTINLADCEEKLGMLVEAQSHWLMARDRAGREGDDRVKQEAEQRLSSLGTRMPRLNIQLVAGVPADAQVFRDEVLLGRVSLATGLPTNPGEHKIIVRAAAHDDSKYTVKLNERDNKTLTVDVGAVNKSAPKAQPEGAAGAATVPSAPVESTRSQAAPVAATVPAPHDGPEALHSSAGTMQRVFGAVVGGLGLVSFGVSGLFWRKASSDIKVDPNGRKLAQDDLLITNVGLVAGSVLVTGGIVLLLTAPSSPSSASAPASLRPSLLVGKNTAVFGAVGSF